MCFFIFSFSGIKPIIDFGWMMTLGLIVSLIVTFLLLPSLLSILASDKEIDLKDTEKSLITSAYVLLQKNKIIILVLHF